MSNAVFYLTGKDYLLKRQLKETINKSTLYECESENIKQMSEQMDQLYDKVDRFIVLLPNNAYLIENVDAFIGKKPHQIICENFERMNEEMDNGPAPISDEQAYLEDMQNQIQQGQQQVQQPVQQKPTQQVRQPQAQQTQQSANVENEAKKYYFKWPISSLGPNSVSNAQQIKKAFDQAVTNAKVDPKSIVYIVEYDGQNKWVFQYIPLLNQLLSKGLFRGVSFSVMTTDDIKGLEQDGFNAIDIAQAGQPIQQNENYRFKFGDRLIETNIPQQQTTKIMYTDNQFQNFDAQVATSTQSTKEAYQNSIEKFNKFIISSSKVLSKSSGEDNKVKNESFRRRLANRLNEDAEQIDDKGGNAEAVGKTLGRDAAQVAKAAGQLAGGAAVEKGQEVANSVQTVKELAMAEKAVELISIAKKHPEAYKALHLICSNLGVANGKNSDRLAELKSKIKSSDDTNIIDSAFNKAVQTDASTAGKQVAQGGGQLFLDIANDIKQQADKNINAKKEQAKDTLKKALESINPDGFDAMIIGCSDLEGFVNGIDLGDLQGEAAEMVKDIKAAREEPIKTDNQQQGNNDQQQQNSDSQEKEKPEEQNTETQNEAWEGFLNNYLDRLEEKY